MSKMIKLSCYKCDNEIELEEIPTRSATCPNCEVYLHSCKNCRFYDVDAYHQCREPAAEWVKDKEMGNFCEYFEPRIDTQKFLHTKRKEDALKKLDALFKK